MSALSDPTRATVEHAAPGVEYERPEGRLARGAWSVPAWVVGGLGAVLLLGVLTLFLLRYRRQRQLLRDERAPHSSSSPLSSRR